MMMDDGVKVDDIDGLHESIFETHSEKGEDRTQISSIGSRFTPRTSFQTTHSACRTLLYTTLIISTPQTPLDGLAQQRATKLRRKLSR